ncbi:MAG: precorrin-3B C(17)-methyltransferase, partial [Acidimicrobiia bacterium]|nr:precorrin-3B C(17)-methyltransferase [Acidimicrobiia bacterium]
PSAGPQPGPHPGSDGEQGPAEIVVSERIDDAPRAGRVTLHPANLVLGIGSAADVGAAEVDQLVERVLADSGLARASVGAVASIDLKADEAGIVALGLPLVTFPAGVLAAIEVPNPSAVVEAAVGTPSVAEAAALAAAGPGAELVVPKRRSAQATVAVARRVGPAGHLAVVGLGPGGAAHRTPAASTAIRHATHVVGYDLYLDLCRDLLSPHQEVVASPIGAEADRCQRALELAAEGGRVALVCSGDPGVFAMASLALELAPGAGNPPVEIVPGVTASLAAAAVLGAPLGHDHASISLSDLLTPWPVIERRVRAVAEADLVCALYNPRSQRRTHQLVDALAILAAHRPPDCPVGIVSQAGRADERVVLDTLATVDPEAVDMLSIVIVGASGTTVINGRMVTPRGYRP